MWKLAKKIELKGKSSFISYEYFENSEEVKRKYGKRYQKTWGLIIT